MEMYEPGFVYDTRAYYSESFSYTVLCETNENHEIYLMLPAYEGKASKPWQLQDGDLFVDFSDDLIPVSEEKIKKFIKVRRIDLNNLYKMQTEMQIKEKKKYLRNGL